MQLAQAVDHPSDRRCFRGRHIDCPSDRVAHDLRDATNRSIGDELLSHDLERTRCRNG